MKRIYLDEILSWYQKKKEGNLWSFGVPAKLGKLTSSKKCSQRNISRIMSISI